MCTHFLKLPFFQWKKSYCEQLCEMVPPKKGRQDRKSRSAMSEVVTREYTINLHKRIFGVFVLLFCFLFNCFLCTGSKLWIRKAVPRRLCVSLPIDVLNNRPALNFCGEMARFCLAKVSSVRLYTCCTTAVGRFHDEFAPLTNFVLWHTSHMLDAAKMRLMGAPSLVHYRRIVA